MSTFLQKELHDIGGTKRDVTNQLVRTDTVDLINKLRLTVPGTLINVNQGSEDYVNASPGMHAFPELKSDWAHISSLGAGTICNKQLTVSDSSIIEGVHFKGESNPLIFRSCMFERTNQPKGPVWVSVESGALVVFIGCVFRGGKYPNTGGTIIKNAGAATRVQLAGCISVTGLTYATVTSSGQGNINT